MLKKLILISGLLLLPFQINAQIIPPALGKTNLNSWFAFGVNQKLDTLKVGGWKSTTYMGIGTISHKHQSNPFKDIGIGVINQEFYHNFAPNWQYSLALSYRQQYLFADEVPFEKTKQAYKQEFRWYGRFSYTLKLNKLTITPTFRQEIIKYFTPNYENHIESWRLRSRFRLKFAFPLTSDNSHQLIAYSEQLFSTSQHSKTKKWDKFEYADSRFAIYYSLSPLKHSFTYNFGYMHNLIGSKNTFSGHYIALDIIWKNPFG